jgi:hypothetical protein
MEYAPRKVQENQKGMEFSGTHHLLDCDINVNISGENINFIKKNTEALSETVKDVGLEVNTEKSKYIVVSHHQNVGQNHNLLIAR